MHALTNCPDSAGHASFTGSGSFADSLRRRGLGAATITAYCKDIRLFEQWRGNLDITAGLEADMLGWIHELRTDQQLSAASVRRRIASCRAYLRYRGIDDSAFAAYRKPPLPAPRPHPLPNGGADVYAMLAVSAGRTRHVIALGGLAGLRVSESCSVQRCDVSESRGELRVCGKGEKVRYVPISTSLRAILAEMPDEGRLVPLNSGVARRYITQAGKAAGIAVDVSSHDLRATFASECYKATRDIVLVSRLLGHASVKTTQTYLGWNTEDMRKAVEF